MGYLVLQELEAFLCTLSISLPVHVLPHLLNLQLKRFQTLSALKAIHQIFNPGLQLSLELSQIFSADPRFVLLVVNSESRVSSLGLIDGG